jgi:hypothetical protein
VLSTQIAHVDMFKFYLGCVLKQGSSVLSFSLLYPVAIYTESTSINHLKENETASRFIAPHPFHYCLGLILKQVGSSFICQYHQMHTELPTDFLLLTNHHHPITQILASELRYQKFTLHLHYPNLWPQQVCQIHRCVPC